MTEIITRVDVKSLHIYAIRSQCVNGVVFGHDAPQGVPGAAVPKPKLSRHVDVSCSGRMCFCRWTMPRSDGLLLKAISL